MVPCPWGLQLCCVWMHSPASVLSGHKLQETSDVSSRSSSATLRTGTHSPQPCSLGSQTGCLPGLWVWCQAGNGSHSQQWLT